MTSLSNTRKRKDDSFADKAMKNLSEWADVLKKEILEKDEETIKRRTSLERGEEGAKKRDSPLPHERERRHIEKDDDIQGQDWERWARDI